MATWDDVRSIALDLPGAVEDSSGSTVAWRVGGKAFAWERVLRRGEREQLGERAGGAAGDGPALGLRTAFLDGAGSGLSSPGCCPGGPSASGCGCRT